MNQPSVVAVCLVNGRKAMVRRAVASFKAQTYPNKRLLLWDSTPGLICCDQTEREDVYHVPAEPLPTIGQLRNAANGFWNTFDILCHFDSDDYSGPRRIEEQVSLLQGSGKEAVGYRDILFWKADQAIPWETVHCNCGKRYPRSGAPCWQCGQYPDGEAWLYTGGPSYCLGTSLCYWRSAWEKRPFEDLPKGPTGAGEDFMWLKGVDHLGVSSIPEPNASELEMPYRANLAAANAHNYGPRMIASIHGSNTSSMAALAIRRGASEIKRAPEWDSYCRERMVL